MRKFYPIMEEWSRVPVCLLTQDRRDVDAIVDGDRGIVAFSARPDPLEGVIEEVFA